MLTSDLLARVYEVDARVDLDESSGAVRVDYVGARRRADSDTVQ